MIFTGRSGKIPSGLQHQNPVPEPAQVQSPVLVEGIPGDDRIEEKKTEGGDRQVSDDCRSSFFPKSEDDTVDRIAHAQDHHDG